MSDIKYILTSNHAFISVHHNFGGLNEKHVVEDFSPFMHSHFNVFNIHAKHFT